MCYYFIRNLYTFQVIYCVREHLAATSWQIFGMCCWKCMKRPVEWASTGTQLCGKMQAKTDREQLAAEAAVAAAKGQPL